jgi:hypothetical protein
MTMLTEEALTLQSVEDNEVRSAVPFVSYAGADDSNDGTPSLR